MGLIDAATAPLRYVLNGAEQEAGAAKDVEQIQAHVLAAVDAIRQATEQVEAHVEVIEKLVSTLTPLAAAMTQLAAQMPALVESVNGLGGKLDVVTEVLQPVARAEQDVTRIGHLFSRRRPAALQPPKA